MFTSKTSYQRAPRRRLPLSEKRRIVELTLREGASIRAIAHEHGISRNSLRRWQMLYRSGKLGARPVSRARAGRSSATFLPVTIAPAVPRSARAVARDASAANVVQVMFASGATLRIETAALDAELICALAAELQR